MSIAERGGGHHIAKRGGGASFTVDGVHEKTYLVLPAAVYDGLVVKFRSFTPQRHTAVEKRGRRKEEDGKGIRKEDGRKWVSSKEFYYHGITMPFPHTHAHKHTQTHAHTIESK